MGNITRLGFVGLGIMGRDLLKPAVENSNARVAALCDIDPGACEQARTIAADAAVFDNYSEMLEAGGLDGVVVATPQYLHAEMSIAALKAGYHVFCEKPMAMNVDECEAMIAASKRTGKGLMIGQVLRYITVYRYVLEEARSGKYGAPVAMRTIRSMGPWDEPWIKPWRLKYETSGGILPEVNIHEIDLMLNILGEPVSVCALGDNFSYEDVDYEDFMTFQITFANGAIGDATSSCSDYLGRHSGEIFCKDGTIYFDSLSNQVHTIRAGEERQTQAYDEVYADAEDGVAREVREFIETCLGECDVTIPGEEGMRALEVCQAAYLSARERRIVELPLPRVTS